MQRFGFIKVVAISFLLLAASLLMCYPFISNLVFENRADSLIDTLEEEADDTPDETKVAELEKARRFNEEGIGSVTLTDPFVEDLIDSTDENYLSVLNMNEDGVMGFVSIPKIDVKLPIYHGTSEATLGSGVGHLQGSSLPVGGASTHAILTGHSGLSSAKMFSDLPLLEEGDFFFIETFGEKLAYQVDQIKTILPEELQDLTVVEGEDYVTLVTCTPIRINTHRLLVRGTRVPDYQEAVEQSKMQKPADTSKSEWMEEYTQSLILGVCVLVIGGCALVFWRLRSNSREFQDHFQ